MSNEGRDLNRVELWRVVPRSVPFAIGITSSDICNFRCVYCNQSTIEGIKDAQVLTWDNFILIINQIEDLLKNGKDDLKIIRFIGNGEPLVNKKLPDMIRYISEKKICNRIEVTTNGSLLTNKMSDQLIDAGLTRLLISVQGTSSKKYQDICGFNIDYDRFVDQIKYFYDNKGSCGLFVKTVDIALDNSDDEKKFYDTFKPISDVTCVEKIIDACENVDYSSITNKDISHETRYGGSYNEKKCCDTLFMYLNIHSNGDVDCCGCKYPPLYIGNVYDKPISKIWNGEVHKKIMIEHAKGNRGSIDICKNCKSINSFGSFPEDNLDEHLDEIYNRLCKLD
ncbi:4Fe-4S single cluster domain-containing protein [Lachnospiraceae bacterium G41]|nr:4Fe-4S single cluster domain-containing protein [Lachnospiraceae bacterium G41]